MALCSKNSIKELSFRGQQKNTVTSGYDFYLMFLLISDDNNPATSHGKAQKEPEKGVWEQRISAPILVLFVPRL